MPNISDFSNEKDWMSACMHQVVTVEGKPREQAIARCLNQWRQKGKNKKEAALNVGKLISGLEKTDKPTVFLGGVCDDDSAWRKDIKKKFGDKLHLIDPYDDDWSTDNIYGELALILKVNHIIFYQGGDGTKNEKEFLDNSNKKYKSFEKLEDLKSYLKSLIKMKKCASDVLRGIVAKLGAKYKSCNTQVPLPENLTQNILTWGKANVPTSDLYNDEDKDKGLENDIHITLLYGLESEDIDKVREILKNVKSFEVRLGMLNVFKDAKKHDVLKIDIECPMLVKLHYLIEKECSVESSYPTYHPHLTSCYVKKDKANKFIGDETFKGQVFMADTIIFSDKSGERIPIHLQ